MKKILVLIAISIVIIVILGFVTKIFFMEDTSKNNTLNLKYSFDEIDNKLGFNSNICDLPADYDEELYKVEEFVNINEKYGINEQAYYIVVNNSSADIFHFIYKKIENLEVNTTYMCNFKLKLFTPYSIDSIGIGGSPSSNVYIKAGIISKFPTVEDVDGYLVLKDIDKGNQVSKGKDLLTLGTLGDEQKRYDDLLFEVNKEEKITFKTNEQGEAYIVVGYDSGFEGLNIVGIKSIKLEFQ